MSQSTVAHAPQPAEQAGDALLRVLQKQTGFVPSHERPGWGFDLDGAVLEPNLRPDLPDAFTPAQRAGSIALDFVFLQQHEHQKAEGRAATLFRKYGGDPMSLRHVMIEERAFVALASIDGRPLVDDAEKERLWAAMGQDAQGIIIQRYVAALGGNDKARGAMLEGAVARSADTFRVRG